MTNPGPDPAPPQRPEPAPGAPATVVYTCPMHPQIRRNGPGACPICGMTLEPLTVALETGPGPERIDMTRRFWAGVVLTVPLMALAMGAHLSWLHLEDLVPARVLGVGAVRAGEPGRAVGRLAVLRARLGVGGAPQPEHVQPDRARHRHRLPLQRGRNRRAGPVPGRPAHDRRHRRGLFRGRRGDHRAGAARPGAGTARPRTDRRGDPRAARPGAQDRAPPHRRRRRRGHPARAGAGRRPAARAAGRQRAGRRRRAGGTQQRRRGDDHRGGDSGRQNRRAPGWWAAPSTAPARW